MIDPIGLEVARNRLSSVAEEMGVVLRRTSFSPNIKERADCSAAIFTPAGEMLAQAEHIPVHLGAMPASVAAVLERFEPEPGVQYAVNDPFAGGTHLNDLTLVTPIFVDGRHVAWAGNRAHHADVGGEAPGSMPAHATRLDQEGHVVSPMVCARDGEWLPEFIEPFLTATRTPAERRGDLSAQVGANQMAVRRLTELISSEGVERFQRVSAALLDYGERRMRAALTELPDGVYRFEDVMEWGDVDVPIRVAVSIEGDGLIADFIGTHEQIPANFNAPEAVTRSASTTVRRRSHHPRQRWVLSPSRPRPEGPSLPGHRRWRPATSRRASASPMSSSALGRSGPGPCRPPPRDDEQLPDWNDRFAYYETVAEVKGSTGTRWAVGHPDRDEHEEHFGSRSRPTIRSGASTTLRRERRTRQYRGGDGIVRELAFDEPATLSDGERRCHGRGFAGGEPGAPGEL